MAVTGTQPLTERDTILVLRALGLGDLLTAVPALRGLRRAHPGARIVLATPRPLGRLALLSGAVDQILPTAGLGLLPRTTEPPALAVNLHGSGPQSIADLLGAAPGRVITYRHRDHPQIPGPPWRAGRHEIDRWCALLETAGIPCDAEDLALPRPAVPPARSGVVVIHPGAAAPARRWPAERFASVAAALRADGNEVVVTGTAGEAALARAVAEAAGLPDGAVLAGALDVLGLVALIADARLLVCGDTGVAHVATATGTPSVLLFGPTPPARWGPRGSGPHIALWAGDVGDPHGRTPHSGLLLITPARVIAETRRLLGVAA